MSNLELKERAESISKQIKDIIKQDVKIAIILGSGLAGIADMMEDKIAIPYTQLKGMPMSKVQGHKNQFIFGKLGNKNVLAMQGRFHMYDGFSCKEATLPICIFKLLGIETLVVTNASGGVNPNFKPSDIMIINDFINLTGTNPCIDGNVLNLGPQFADMSEPFDYGYIDRIKAIAKKENISLVEGTYAQNYGPQYETKAEVRRLQNMGADAVGMSTVVEVMLAVQYDIKVLGLSCICNMGTGLATERLTHQEVLDNGVKMSKNLIKLVSEFVKEI